MKVTSNFIKRLHLDPKYGLLNASSAQLVLEYFRLLDCKGTGGIDDIQFAAFLSTSTDLSKSQIYKIFDIFDLDRSGSCEFDEFYLLVCILVAINDNKAKHFLYRHWRTCFELLDEDGSKAVSREEFETLGFLFGFSRAAVKRIYDEFDVSGNQELDYNEFRLFVFAAIDAQEDLERRARSKALKKKHGKPRLLMARLTRSVAENSAAVV
ncbi:EF-hand calcium-binding domain-containing protein 9 [Allomyces arbusculus]|nr:EF-hand calcium-binding domain-containing protein 9 [Allomyces arbusculus]